MNVIVRIFKMLKSMRGIPKLLKRDIPSVNTPEERIRNAIEAKTQAEKEVEKLKKELQSRKQTREEIKSERDAIEMKYLIGLPIVAFIVPAFFLMVQLAKIFIPWYMIILPIATFFVPFAFFIKYVMDIHNFAPEAVPFRTARKLRMKGEVGDVIRIVEGNDVVKHGVLKVDVATGKIFYKTKQYGIKINPSEYPSIPSERTPDGVRMFNFAPVQITPVTGSGAVAVDELIKYVRTNHTELNHLSDVALGTLLSKTGKELELDAHLFLDRSKNPTITEPDIVKTVKTIQKTEGAKELVIEPAGRFFVYRKAMEVVNCAYTGAFLQDAILTVKQLTLAKAEKPSYANVLIWVVAIIAVLMGGVVAFKMLGMS